MTCGEIREQLVETARGRELSSDLRAIVFAHVAGCDTCAVRLESEQRLTTVLAQLSYQCEGAPARVENILRRQLPVAPLRKTQPKRLIWIYGSMAAAILIAVMLMRMDRTRPVHGSAGTPVEAEVGGFMPLPYAADISPEEATAVIRVQLQRQSLLAMGVPVAGDRLEEQIHADVLIGMDGTARAIRITD